MRGILKFMGALFVSALVVAIVWRAGAWIGDFTDTPRCAEIAVVALCGYWVGVRAERRSCVRNRHA